MIEAFIDEPSGPTLTSEAATIEAVMADLAEQMEYDEFIYELIDDDQYVLYDDDADDRSVKVMVTDTSIYTATGHCEVCDAPVEIEPATTSVHEEILCEQCLAEWSKAQTAEDKAGTTEVPADIPF